MGYLGRILALLVLTLALLPGAAAAQDAATEPRAETGGAQTLEDILRRQRGEEVDQSFRREETGDPEGAPPMTGQLGTLGGASDPDLWRALRFGSADVTSQVRAPGATLLVQDSGMEWLLFRQGPLRTYGGYFLLAMIGLLAVFFLIRGRIRIDAGRSGITIERFKAVERFGHWLLAGSFILLGLTGLFTLYARLAIGRPAETGLSDEASIMARSEASSPSSSPSRICSCTIWLRTSAFSPRLVISGASSLMTPVMPTVMSSTSSRT